MNDPMTVAFEIRYPWRAYSRAKRAAQPKDSFVQRYRHSFITVWHVDPETDGSDDSCEWFVRGKHADPKVLERIKKAFLSDWDRTWTYEKKDGGDGTTYPRGLFLPYGLPRLSPTGIMLNLFFIAAREMHGYDKAMRFMRRHLFDIMLFAENTSDSMFDSMTMALGPEERTREERVARFAWIVFGWILRVERPWWKHPRWHFWHWKIQVHPWQNARRWLLTRCCKCGGRFRYAESPVSNSWNRKPLRWFRGEEGLHHMDCSRPGQSNAAQSEKVAA